MVAAIASRVIASAALKHLTRKQQKRAINIMFGAGAATEAALQLLGKSYWTAGDTSQIQLYCGQMAQTLWIEQSCGSNGSDHSLQISSAITWHAPRIGPNQAKHVVDNLRYGVPNSSAVTATLRGVLWNRHGRERFVTTRYPIGLSFIDVVRPVDQRKPGVLYPGVVQAIPGLSSKVGEEPSSRTNPVYLTGGWNIVMPGAPARPITQPRPRPKPTDKPGEIVFPAVPIPGVRPRYQPKFIPRAVPARMERHGKVEFAPAGAAPIVFEWLDTASEFADVVDAIYRALPRDVRKNYEGAIKRTGDLTGGLGGPGREAEATHIKLQAIYNNLHQLDGEQAAANLLVNAVEDMAVGETERRRGDLFNKIRGVSLYER